MTPSYLDAEAAAATALIEEAKGRRVTILPEAAYLAARRALTSP